MSAEDRLFDVDYGLREYQRTRLINLSGKVRADHPSTSHEAARLIAPKSGTKRQQVLREIASVSPRGITDEEICSVLRMNPSTERPRRVELVEAGWVRNSGRTRKTRSGCDSVIWELTDAGREVL